MLLFVLLSGFWTWFMCNISIWNYASSNSPILLWAPCFVSSGSSQWSGREVDLTDHPWVMMMRGLLLLKPQEVRVCSCRGSSSQTSSPSKNNLKVELLTCGSSPIWNLLCSLSATPQKNKWQRSYLFVLHDCSAFQNMGYWICLLWGK